MEAWEEGLGYLDGLFANPRTYAGLGLLSIALGVILVPGIEGSSAWLLCCIYATIALLPE
jgi:hypothetical protein